tara:strand:- start:422 stop:682 length:261 start_codon:yes stop_codon:yes gene_type:complete
MKVFLFFLGSLIRWPAQRTKDFLIFHSYLLIIYLITYLAKPLSQGLSSFLFTIGMMLPLFLAIYRGLPLDCLNYQSVIEREMKALL